MAKTGPRKIENQRVSRIPAYEPLRLNGWIILEGERNKVTLSRTVKTRADNIPLTAARIAELAAEQGIKCRIEPILPDAPSGFVPPEPETAGSEASEVSS